MGAPFQCPEPATHFFREGVVCKFARVQRLGLQCHVLSAAYKPRRRRTNGGRPTGSIRSARNGLDSSSNRQHRGRMSSRLMSPLRCWRNFQGSVWIRGMVAFVEVSSASSSLLVRHRIASTPNSAISRANPARVHINNLRQDLKGVGMVWCRSLGVVRLGQRWMR